jgi:endonuclease III
MTARKRPTPDKKNAASKKPTAGKGSKSAPKAVAKPAAKPHSKPAVKAGATPAKATSKVPAKLEKPAPEPKTVIEKVPPRGQLLPKLHKALKANYKPFPADPTRPLLHQVLIACCLENAPPDAAERAFNRLMETYFDLNEVRVTTVAELAETLHDLPDPARAALSLRRALQGVFESTYSFSLEHARKHSLAHGMKVLEGLHGVPSYVINYVASTALGGHFIPLDQGALAGLWLCGMITQQEYDTGKVPGIERVIGKKAGIEFSSLLHQFGLDVLTNLHGTTVRKVVLAANPAAKDRFPKRGEPLPAPVPPAVTDRAGIKAADAARAAAEELRPAGPQAAARPAGKTPLPPPGSGPKKNDGKGKSGPKPFVVKPLTIKPQMAPPPLPEPVPPPAAPKKPVPKADGTKHSSNLSKRKPR